MDTELSNVQKDMMLNWRAQLQLGGEGSLTMSGRAIGDGNYLNNSPGELCAALASYAFLRI